MTMKLTPQVEAILDQRIEDLEEIDMDEAYDRFIDELYEDKMDLIDFLRGTTPSRLMKEYAPVDYRCGKCDWIDGESRDRNVTEYNEKYYVTREFDDLVEEIEAELNVEAILNKETDNAE